MGTEQSSFDWNWKLDFVTPREITMIASRHWVLRIARIPRDFDYSFQQAGCVRFTKQSGKVYSPRFARKIDKNQMMAYLGDRNGHQRKRSLHPLRRGSYVRATNALEKVYHPRWQCLVSIRNPFSQMFKTC